MKNIVEFNVHGVKFYVTGKLWYNLNFDFLFIVGCPPPEILFLHLPRLYFPSLCGSSNSCGSNSSSSTASSNCNNNK